MIWRLDTVDRAAGEVDYCGGTLEMFGPVVDGAAIPLDVLPVARYLGNMSRQQYYFATFSQQKTRGVQTDKACTSGNHDLAGGVWCLIGVHGHHSNTGRTSPSSFVLRPFLKVLTTSE
jgi:hypothetical protein